MNLLIKNLMFAIVSSTIMLISSPSSANQCGFIKDADERNYCEATARNNPALCGAIKEADKRNLCSALVRKNKGLCGFIKAKDLRYSCYSKF